MRVLRPKFSRFFRILGPGLITGAADDDPSGIATYTQTGAQFGFGMLWTAIFMLPFMIAVQEACARIGAVTGKGVASLVRANYNRKILMAVILLVLVANIINIGADIGAMAAAAELVLPVPFAVLALFFAAFTLLLLIFTSYKTYARILKWLALTLLAYPLTMIVVSQDWSQILRATFTPHFEFSFDFLFIITGVLGTTISPYLFFWQASEEVEEEKELNLIRPDGRPKVTKTFMRNLRIDNTIGMVTSNIAAWSIIVVGASVLHAHGLHNVQTAADAAKALEPLVQTFPNAGFIAKLIFSTGVIGLGLLAIPVLAGSASYAIAEAFDWEAGLNLKFKQAHGFYGVIAIATIIGLAINFVGIDPIKALVFTAVFNGVAAVPLLFIIAKLAGNKEIMGEHVSGPVSRILVWVTFIGMAAAAVAMFYSLAAR